MQSIIHIDNYVLSMLYGSFFVVQLILKSGVYMLMDVDTLDETHSITYISRCLYGQ